MLSSYAEHQNLQKYNDNSKSDNGLPTPPTSFDKNTCVPNQFIACVRTLESSIRVKDSLKEFSVPVKVLHEDNMSGVQPADIVLLACNPNELEECLESSDVRRVLRDKLLISVLAGITIEDIERVLFDVRPDQELSGRGRIVRAMPNTASMVRHSMTVITSSNNISEQDEFLVDWLFGSIGEVSRIANHTSTLFDAGTALCGSGPAFFAMFTEAMIEGAVALGIKRSQAVRMAANTMKGTAEMILVGEPPAVVREKVACPGGSTMVGLLKLEQGCLRSITAHALIDCAIAASQLGKKKK